MAFKMSEFSGFKNANNKRRLKEVKSSIRDLRIERLKKIGNNILNRHIKKIRALV